MTFCSGAGRVRAWAGQSSTQRIQVIHFSLSVAGSGSVIYGSYLGKDVELSSSARNVAVFDTLAALVATLVIIPAMATTGSQVDSRGPGLMFISLPGVFNGMGTVGWVVGAFFFLAVLFFALRPGEILTWVGKVLNPLFLAFLALLLLRALTAPGCDLFTVEPVEDYASGAFATGLLEGYNTMDALAGLAFGIIVVDVIRGLGVQEPGEGSTAPKATACFASCGVSALVRICS